MHITLTGNLGSGKSTICKILREKYGFEIYSTGTVQRRIAEEMGISVLEMNELMCKDHSYDHLIDDTTARIARENPDKNIVFDSRLAWHFVEKSYKIFLSVSIDEAARRVFSDSSRGQVESYKSLEDCKDKLIARAANEDKRYEDIYGIHYFNFDNYNLILDSSNTAPEVLAETIVKLASDAWGKEESRTILFSPERLGYEKSSEKSGDVICKCEGVVIKKNDNDYELVSGREQVMSAAAAGCELVSCTLA